MKKLTVSDFARHMDTSEKDMPQKCVEMIQNKDLSCCALSGKERDHEILNCIKHIDADQKDTRNQAERQNAFQRGWSEILQDFIDSDYNFDALLPGYYQKEQNIFRWEQELVYSENSHFCADIDEIVRCWAFATYLNSDNTVYEFGCGTGKNLVEIAKMYPDKEVIGTDFVQPSVDLANLIGEKCGLKIYGGGYSTCEPPMPDFISNRAVKFSHPLRWSN